MIGVVSWYILPLNKAWLVVFRQNLTDVLKLNIKLTFKLINATFG